MAQTLLDGGAVAIADIRLRSIERLRYVDLICPMTMISPPIPIQKKRIVARCDPAYNSLCVVMSGLAPAATKNDVSIERPSW